MLKPIRFFTSKYRLVQIPLVNQSHNHNNASQMGFSKLRTPHCSCLTGTGAWDMYLYYSHTNDLYLGRKERIEVFITLPQLKKKVALVAFLRVQRAWVSREGHLHSIVQPKAITAFKTKSSSTPLKFKFMAVRDISQN